MAGDEEKGRLEELFARAVELAPEERDDYLDRQCAGDLELRARLAALLSQDERDSDGVLDRRLFGSEPPAQEHIDRYKLLEKLGEGGMGTVYLAEQEDPVRRKVALKTVRLGASGKSALERFDAERQALAMMNHPYIAEIYDGGLAPSGLPYFVMEYCPGLPLTEHCDRFELSIAQRISLFRRVCNGVQHAHQKGIIHRDLKPGNILVTEGDGQAVPKIIDFGIARAVSRSLDKDRRDLTGTHAIGSQLYMSPEQANATGADVDTRTDIYSLGVILYELLAGVPPLTHEAIEEFGASFLRDVDPPEPSRRVKQEEAAAAIAARRGTTAHGLVRALQGDLDWITMRCLEKDRIRRYASASELAADLGRYVENEPVVAGPPTTTYRARKFVRRHRASVAGASLLLLSLVAGIVGTIVGMRRAQRAEAIALDNFELATESLALAQYEARKSFKVLEFFWYGLVHGHPTLTGEQDEQSLLEMVQDSDEGLQRLFSGHPAAEAAVRTSLGYSLLYLGQDRAALQQLLHARSIQQLDRNTQAIDAFVTVTGLLQATRRIEGLESAEKYTAEALELAREILGAGAPELTAAVDGLIALARGEPVDEQETLAHLGDLMQAFPESLHYGDESVVMGRLILEVGVALRRRDDDVSDEFFAALETKMRELLPEDGLALGTVLWIVARAQLLSDDEQKLLDAIDKAGEISALAVRSNAPPEFWLLPEARWIEGVARMRLKDPERAEPSLRNAWETLEPVAARNDRQRDTFALALAWHARCLGQQGRQEEAQRVFQRLESLSGEPLRPETRALVAEVGRELSG